MNQILFIVMLSSISNTKWIQIDKSSTTTVIDQNAWSDLVKAQCNPGVNNLEYNESPSFLKDFQYKCFQVRVIFDVFFIDADPSVDSSLQVQYWVGSWSNLYTKPYKTLDLTQQANRICTGTGGLDTTFDLNTIVTTSSITNTNYFIIKFLNFRSGAAKTGIRNILIYANFCSSKCATCSGPNSNECLTCYYGSVTSGQCFCDQSHQFSLERTGCIQECPRDSFMADSNFNCVPDSRVQPKYQFFEIDHVFTNGSPKYQPFLFIGDQQRAILEGLAYDCLNGPDFIGYFYHNDGVSLLIPAIESLVFIRLRVTFYILYLSPDSKIKITLDSAMSAEIKKTSTGYAFNNAINIFTDTLDCPPIFTRIRIETILRTQSLNPVLVIQGQLQSVSDSWGFYDVTVDAGKCRKHCSICQSFSICQQCEFGYFLYQQECVITCPIYSYNCVDYSEEYQYSRYLLKGFYDVNMTFEEINSVVDSMTNVGTNFKTGQIFSFFPDKIVLGGVMVWNSASFFKTFNILKPHYAITIRFNMTFGDEYSGSFYYIIDSSLTGPFHIPASGENLVGKSNQERTTFFHIYLNPQTLSTLHLELRCVNAGDIRDGFCAISEYFIVVHYCPPFCDVCSSSSVCTTWQSGYTSSECATGYYLSFDQLTETYSCESCRPECQTCNSWDECTSCSNPLLSLYSSLCISLPCRPGYYDDGYSLYCSPICGDLIVVDGEDCDDDNSYPFDGCANCRYQCHQQCLFCINGKCVECQGQGWHLNQLTNDCETICGDGIVAGLEQCDDGNDDSEDLCKECQSQCQHCNICDKGLCLLCQEGWILQSAECIPINEDVSVIVEDDECDDGNDIPYDGCFEGRYSCQEQCTDCKQICIACDTIGWKISNNLCYPLCGDGYVVEGQEQCDDGNDVKYDGCFECQFECQKECTDCQLGICHECNSLGWEIIDHQCIPHCGDGLVFGSEQCDDMNQISNDGCDQCKFACDQYCIDCWQGICVDCGLGRYSSNMNMCKPKCGDGQIVQFTEQCDDGNDENNDGCDSTCKVEINWVCFNIAASQSFCQYSQSPDFQLKLVTVNSDDVQKVQLTFNQPMKLSSSVTGDGLNFVTALIPELENSQYSITKYLDMPFQYGDVSNSIINFSITFYVPVVNPILEITFINNPVISEYNQTLRVNKKVIMLLTPQILSESQLSVAQSAQAFSKVIIYCVIGLASLRLLTGSADLFWNLMDQLQYLSFIQYINIQFPRNLNIYFQVFKMVSISPFINALGIDKLFALLDGEKEYFIETSNKFLYDNINAYFFINCESFIFYFVISFVTYQVMKQGYQLLHRISIKSNQIYFNLIVSKIYLKLMKISKTFSKSFYYNGLLRILMSSCYDLSFSAIVQLYYYSNVDCVLIMNYYLAIVVFVVQIGLSILLIGIIQKFVKKTIIVESRKYKALFEDVVQNQNVWVLQYNSLLLLKKQLFIFIIVFMQQVGKLQTLSIALLQSLYLSYLLINQPLKNRYEFYKSIITESIIIFNTITFLVYALQVELLITSGQIIQLGWIHIFSSTMILGVSLIIDFVQQVKIQLIKIQEILRRKYRQNKQMQPLERIQ